MEEEKKQVNEQLEETENNNNAEEKILRPTISSEELLRNKESNNNHKELTAKVEQYNFNNGFKNTKQVNESLVEAKEETPLTTFQNNNEKIDIKPPRKKNKMLPIILFLIVLLGGGIYYYLNFFNKKDLIKAPVEEEEPALEEKKEKQNKTVCRLAIKSEAQKQNTIIEYIYYDKEEKLKAYEQNTTFEYLEEVPKSIIEECNMINKNYEGYNGYNNVCIENDELSYTFSTKVDLSKLEEKTLIFDNNTITITASLDDDTSSLKEEYESANYECVTEEIEVSEE